MKKFALCIVALLALNVMLAQDDSKDTFVKKGNTIEATLYHDNGEVSQTGYYNEDNKLHGEWVSYSPDGTKTAIAQYDNGNKVGTWKFFDGISVREVIYKDSKIAKVISMEVKDTRVVVNE